MMEPLSRKAHKVYKSNRGLGRSTHKANAGRICPKGAWGQGYAGQYHQTTEILNYPSNEAKLYKVRFHRLYANIKIQPTKP